MGQEECTKMAQSPQSNEAELAVLAALLGSPDVLLDIVSIKKLQSSDFATPRHTQIYEKILECDTEGKPFDSVTLGEKLKASSLLDKGMRELLDELYLHPYIEKNVLDYVDIIIDAAKLRDCIESARTIASSAMKPGAVGQDILELAEQEVFKLSQTRSQSDLIHIKEGLSLVLEEMEKASSRTSLLIGESTGLKGLDRLTGGFQRGHLVVLAARPAMGKSALAMQFAKTLAQQGNKVAVLSYEMTVKELVFRMLSAGTGIGIKKLLEGNVDLGMELTVNEQISKIEKLPISISDTPPLTISGVRSILRRKKQLEGLDAVVIDYLQLMSGEKRRNGETRNEEIAEISSGLKMMAKELDVPVIVLSQLNRNVEARLNKRPMPSDLRDSGSIEQDADSILFIYRDVVYNPSSRNDEAELIIGKQRSGPLGTIPLIFEGQCTRFRDAPKDPFN